MTWKRGNAEEFLEDIMTEHVCEWMISFSSNNPLDGVCRCQWCPAILDITQTEARINATERLSALITDLVADASDGVNEMGGPFVAVSVIARILEGKDD